MGTGLELVPFEVIMAELRTRFPAVLLVVEYQAEMMKLTSVRMEFHESRSVSLHAVLGLANYASAMLVKRMSDTTTPARGLGLEQPPEPPKVP